MSQLLGDGPSFPASTQERTWYLQCVDQIRQIVPAAVQERSAEDFRSLYAALAMLSTQQRCKNSLGLWHALVLAKFLIVLLLSRPNICSLYIALGLLTLLLAQSQFCKPIHHQ